MERLDRPLAEQVSARVKAVLERLKRLLLVGNDGGGRRLFLDDRDGALEVFPHVRLVVADRVRLGDDRLSVRDFLAQFLHLRLEPEVLRLQRVVPLLLDTAFRDLGGNPVSLLLQILPLLLQLRDLRGERLLLRLQRRAVRRQLRDLGLQRVLTLLQLGDRVLVLLLDRPQLLLESQQLRVRLRQLVLPVGHLALHVLQLLFRDLVFAVHRRDLRAQVLDLFLVRLDPLPRLLALRDQVFRDRLGSRQLLEIGRRVPDVLLEPFYRGLDLRLSRKMRRKLHGAEITPQRKRECDGQHPRRDNGHDKKRKRRQVCH